MSEMGGMIDIVYLFFAILYGFYYQKAFTPILVKNVFGFDTPKSQEPSRKKAWCLKKTRSSVEPQTKEESEYSAAVQATSDVMDIVSLSKQLNVFRGLSRLLLPPDSEGLVQQYLLTELRQRRESSLAPDGLASGEDPQKNKQKAIMNVPTMKVQLKKKLAKRKLNPDPNSLLAPRLPDRLAQPAPAKLELVASPEPAAIEGSGPETSLLERLRGEIRKLLDAQPQAPQPQVWPAA